MHQSAKEHFKKILLLSLKMESKTVLQSYGMFTKYGNRF